MLEIILKILVNKRIKVLALARKSKKYAVGLF